jgi:hypothetical protein
VSFNIAI